MGQKVVLAALALIALVGWRDFQVYARTQIKQLASALMFFRLDNGRYPTTEEGLQALIEEPLALRGAGTYRHRGYLEGGTVPRDPWGNPYQYASPAVRSDEGFDLWSLGADGAPGGHDLDADIGNWPGGFPAHGPRSPLLLALVGATAVGVLAFPTYLIVGVVRWSRGRGWPSAFAARSLVILACAVLLLGALGLFSIGPIE